MDAYHHLSFTSFLPIIVIGLAKAADELTTFMLVNRFNIQGEANAVSSMFYSYGPIGHIALWALYTGIFAAAYLIYLRIGEWRFRITYKWCLTISVLIVTFIPTINNIAIWIWPS